MIRKCHDSCQEAELIECFIINTINYEFIFFSVNCLQTNAEPVNVFIIHKCLTMACSQLLTLTSHKLLFLVYDCSSQMVLFSLLHWLALHYTKQGNKENEIMVNYDRILFTNFRQIVIHANFKKTSRIHRLFWMAGCNLCNQEQRTIMAHTE